MLLKVSVPFLRLSNKSESVSKVSTLFYHSLSFKSKQKVLDEIYEVYKTSSLTLNKDEFEKSFLNTEGAQVCLFYNKINGLVGFINSSIIFIENEKNKKHAVFCAGVFFRQGFKGGKLAVLFGFSQYLKFKIRNMMTPISYVTLVSNPAVYKLLAENAYRLYPVKNRKTPKYVHTIFDRIVEARNISLIDRDNYLALSQAVPKHASRLSRSENLALSPYAQFFNQMNPDYSQGKAMLVFIELNMISFVLGTYKCIKNIIVSTKS
ncbi:hypothetical protein [uncultured Shewanella sp.]|uniref:hypothetical protein n=1 Tax=uncultured Shewanella sp. TaxID=173975 RepID=UPI002612BF70|nr:hypothetical protein [uncultured Shewanella sp.]